MTETIRFIPMRGFVTSVAREERRRPVQSGAIAVGIDGEGADRRIAFALTHADGTILTAYLSEGAVDRLADILAERMGIVGVTPIGATATVQ